MKTLILSVTTAIMLTTVSANAAQTPSITNEDIVLDEVKICKEEPNFFNRAYNAVIDTAPSVYYLIKDNTVLAYTTVKDTTVDSFIYVKDATKSTYNDFRCDYIDIEHCSIPTE